MRKVFLLFSITIVFCLLLAFPGGQVLADPVVSFKPAVSYPVGVDPEGVGVGDFNGDSMPDLVTTNWVGNNVSVLINKGDGTFGLGVNYTVGSRPEKVAVGDFNNDGSPDLVTANSGSSNVSILINKGDGTFQSVADYPVSGFPNSVAIGDLNGDGIHDLAVAGGANYSYWICVLMNAGDGTFGPAVRYNLGIFDNLMRVALKDLNGDNKPDLVTESYWKKTVSVLMNKGDGTFGSQVDYYTVSGNRDLAVEDFNGDGNPDLATASLGQVVSVLMNKGDGTFQAVVGYPVGHEPRNLVAGDFNGDGKPDLATSSTNDANVYVLINSGDGTFLSPVKVVAGAEVWSMAAGDFNDDGKLDLTLTTGYRNTVSVLINTTEAVNPQPDTVSPATTLTLNGTAGNNGWYVSDVQVVLTAEDNPGGTGNAKTEFSFDGINWDTYVETINITNDGEKTIYYRSTDMAFNIEAIKSKKIKIDKTAPQISVSLPVEGGNYDLGQQISANWSANDSLAGLESAAGTTVSGLLIDTTTVGIKTYTVKAVDAAGNEAEKTVTYHVNYIFSGILPSIDGEAFKLGSVIPVKFRLQDTAGNFINNATAELFTANVSNGGAQGDQPAVSTSRAVEGNIFRDDSSDNQYIFNLDTKGLAAGLWQLSIVLDDGTTRNGIVSLE